MYVHIAAVFPRFKHIKYLTKIFRSLPPAADRKWAQRNYELTYENEKRLGCGAPSAFTSLCGESVCMSCIGYAGTAEIKDGVGVNFLLSWKFPVLR